MKRKTGYIIILGILFVIVLTSGIRSSQPSFRDIEGIIYNQQNSGRIGRVNIRSLSTGFSTSSNLRGEFKMKVLQKDTLIFTYVGFFSTYVVIDKQPFILIKMRPRSLQLKEVIIIDTLKTAEQKYQEIKRQYDSFLKKRKINWEEALSLERATLGLSITAIYDYFSKQGQFARRFDKYLDKERIQLYVDQRFNAGLVHKWTQAEGDELKAFMDNYRPTVQFAFEASEYELIDYIKRSYRLFKLMPDPYTLPDLYVPIAEK